MYGSSGLPANYACQLGLRDLTCEDPSREEYGLKVQECMCEPDPCTTHRMSLSHRSALLGSPDVEVVRPGREDGGHPGHPALYGCPCSLNPTLAVQCWRAVTMTFTAIGTHHHPLFFHTYGICYDQGILPLSPINVNNPPALQRADPRPTFSTLGVGENMLLRSMFNRGT